MFKRMLIKMREKIRSRDYIVTYHARKEMNSDNYTIFDVERGILTGEILERQKDRSTAEWKYLIRGKTVYNDDIELICKLSLTGKLAIITVYRP